jgi:hypothetical protein
MTDNQQRYFSAGLAAVSLSFILNFLDHTPLPPQLSEALYYFLFSIPLLSLTIVASFAKFKIYRLQLACILVGAGLTIFGIVVTIFHFSNRHGSVFVGSFIVVGIILFIHSCVKKQDRPSNKD